MQPERASVRPNVETPAPRRVGITDVGLMRRTNHRRYGTISRYRVITDDDLEREVIHGQSAVSAAGSCPLTLGTAPPLSLGPEGLIMHTLLKAMSVGLDGIVFGPERSRQGIDDGAAVRALAAQVSFERSAQVAHTICDDLAVRASTDLGHMLWTGVSLGAMKGITFAAVAPSRGRRMVYSHFVAPASPYPQPPATEKELRRFQRGELGAMMRLSSELLAHDVGRRMFSLNQNVVRAMRPGLMIRYARSVPRDSVSKVFNEAWQRAVVTGDAGAAAVRLPSNHLATFELFDGDEAGRVDAWRRRLDNTLSDSIRVVVKRGHHTDALRISHQTERARHIGRILRQLRDGVTIDELVHPYG